MALKTAHTPKNTGVIVLSDALYSTVPFTISLWFNLLNNIAGHPDGFCRLLMQQATIPAWKLSIYNNGGNELRFELVTIAGVSVPINADAFITSGVLYHVAATVDAARNMLLYVNSIQQAATATATSISPANDALCIGIDGDTTKGGFDGVSDDIRFYTRVLPVNEIETIFKSPGHDGIEYGLLSRFTMRNN